MISVFYIDVYSKLYRPIYFLAFFAVANILAVYLHPIRYTTKLQSERELNV